MQNLKFLNKKETSNILDKIMNTFGIKELDLNHDFIRNSEDKIFMVSKQISNFDIKNLRINSLGMYFCKIEKNGIRLSVEGSQKVGNLASKNVVELDKAQIKEWLIGNPVPYDRKENGFVIVRHENDFFGAGLLKDGTLINYFPKTRRLKVVNE